MERLKEIYEELFLVEIGEDNQDSDLLEDGFIDSFGLLQLVEILQSEYGVTVTHVMVENGDLNSFNKVLKLLSK